MGKAANYFWKTAQKRPACAHWLTSERGTEQTLIEEQRDAANGEEGRSASPLRYDPRLRPAERDFVVKPGPGMRPVIPGSPRGNVQKAGSFFDRHTDEIPQLH